MGYRRLSLLLGQLLLHLFQLVLGVLLVRNLTAKKM
jgi:hypothetical protein